MTRKARRVQDSSSDDDVPEVISHSTSKADAKRNQKALYNFEAEEKARRKARNRERDQKLKERARVTKGGKKLKGVKFVNQESEGEDEGDGGEDEGDDDDDDDVEARMLRAMRDAADEVASGEGEEDGDGDGEFKGFGRGMDLSDSMDAEATTDDEEVDEDEETTPLQANIHKFSRKADYLADDLFAAAFASQSSKPHSKKNLEPTQQQTAKKRRRKSTTRPKDLLIGGRTIRTLPQPSDPRSQATARSVPCARARKFVDHSLAMKGKRALLKAKKKGWERRPANIGVMKYQGAPHGFVRSTR